MDSSASENIQTASSNAKQTVYEKLSANPKFIVFASVASIVSFFTGIYFYYASVQKPALTFCMNPNYAKIVKAGESSNLSVSYKGSPLKGDVHIATFCIWNAGNKTIPASVNNLAPVTLKIPGDVTLLEPAVREQSKFSDVKINSENKKLLTFEWRILEEGDWALCQIIYEGPDDAKFELDGALEGQRKMTTVVYQKQKSFLWSTLIAIWLGIFVGWLTNRFKRSRGSKMPEADGVLALSLLVLLVVCLGMGGIILLGPPTQSYPVKF